ncbi:MAG: hypothetical protein ACXVAX_07765 [Pseudobdellovibrio sp.]
MQPEVVFKITHILNVLSLAIGFGELLYLRKNSWLWPVMVSLILSLFWPKLLIVSLAALVALLFVYDGAYNGGSDYMNFLVSLALVISIYSENEKVKAACLFYIGAQSILSYLVAGITKLRKAGWRNGASLRKIFEESHYLSPVGFSHYKFVSRLVIISEIGIISGFINFYLGMICVFMFALFHLINIKILKLNRFFFAWLSSYACVLYCFYRV